MMIRLDELFAIKGGELDLAFRRWERPRVVAGTRLRTAVGLIEVLSVDQVAVGSLRSADARRAGCASLTELRERLANNSDRPAYRVELRYAGPDPREALREDIPDGAEIETIWESLVRMDRASPTGPWTRPTLELIDELPEVRAPELAARLGRPTAEFKRNVRKLKEKGLTESLAVGYRLSPRGEAVLDSVSEPRRRMPRAPGTPLPRTIGPAATLALRADGVTSLEDVASRARDDLAELRGVGPVALRRLEEAMQERDLSFARPEDRQAR